MSVFKESSQTTLFVCTIKVQLLHDIFKIRIIFNY